MTPSQIDAAMLEGAGSQWDPQAVEAFMACRQNIYPSIHQTGIGESVALAIDSILVALRNGLSASCHLAEQSPPPAAAG